VCTTRLAELRATLPADTLANLVEKCLADLADRLVSLRDASIQSDREGLKTAAHAMAGMAAEYGMASLEARLRTLMQTACQEPVALSPCVDDVAAELSRTVAALRQALGTELV
jgi:HPt (histidine-containing phosphotransfer) domain-containing protein